MTRGGGFGGGGPQCGFAPSRGPCPPGGVFVGGCGIRGAARIPSRRSPAGCCPAQRHHPPPAHSRPRPPVRPPGPVPNPTPACSTRSRTCSARSRARPPSALPPPPPPPHRAPGPLGPGPWARYTGRCCPRERPYICPCRPLPWPSPGRCAHHQAGQTCYPPIRWAISREPSHPLPVPRMSARRADCCRRAKTMFRASFRRTVGLIIAGVRKCFKAGDIGRPTRPSSNTTTNAPRRRP